jgi:hypothetical protein
MNVYKYSEARQALASLLDEADRTGAVGIRRRDGRTFVLRPKRSSKSPLDVKGVPLPLTAEQIVAFIHEGRRTT